MLKKTITFEDLDGNKITEDFYFNLSKAELIELELSTKDGLMETLKSIVAEQDGAKIIEYFKKIILMAYGKRSDDGRRFIKSEELRTEFSQTDAYSVLFMEFATDAKAAATFVQGIMPAGMVSEDMVSRVVEDVESEPKTVETPITQKPLTEMSREELLEALAKTNPA